MNKKNTIFMMTLIMAYSASVLPIEVLSKQEEELRIDYICRLSQANALGVTQYLENGVVRYDLIERDIALLKQDSQQVAQNKSWAEGYFYSNVLPGCGKIVVIGSGMGALAAGLATVAGSVLTYDVWNSSSVINSIDKVYSKMMQMSEATFPERIEGYLKYAEDKAHYLAEHSDYNRSVLAAAPALPFTFVGTMVLAGLYKYTSNKLSRYNCNNAAFIKQMQDRYCNNQLAIARLQEIAHKGA